MLIEPDIDVLEHQYKFINSDEKFTFLIGGFGSGKSTGIVLRALELLRRRNGKGIVGIIAPTYSLLRDVNLPDFQEWLDRFGIRYTLNKTEFKIIINDEIKGEIWFRSGDRPEKIVGFEWTDFIIDEFDILRYEQQKTVWLKVIARIRGCNDSTGAIATTPEGYKYTYELVNDESKKVYLIEADTTTNIYLPPDYISTLYQQYDDILIDQYIKGKFVNIKGLRAYYAFDRNKHVIPYEEISTSLIHIGMDFNVDPMTSCLSAYYSGKLVTFDEYYIKSNKKAVNIDKTYTGRMCEKIKEDYPNKDIIAYPDMTGVKRGTSANIGVTDLTIIRQAGFTIRGTSNPLIRNRLNTVNGGFANNKLIVMDNCKHLIRDLEQVVTDTYGDIDDSNKDLTHMSDGFGYKVCRLFPIKHKQRKIA